MLTKCNTSAIFCVGNPAGSDDSHLRSIFCDTIGLYVKALRTVHTTDDGTTIESWRTVLRIINGLFTVFTWLVGFCAVVMYWYIIRGAACLRLISCLTASVGSLIDMQRLSMPSLSSDNLILAPDICLRKSHTHTLRYFIHSCLSLVVPNQVEK